MRIRHVFILFGIAFIITYGVILIAASDNGNDAENDAEMGQEIVSTLHKIVELRERTVLFAQANHEQGITDLREILQAQLKLSAARIRLAMVEGKRDVALKEYHIVLAIHEQQLRVIQEKIELGLATLSNLVDAEVEQLEERVRLATLIRDIK